MLNIFIIHGRLVADPHLKDGKTEKYASFALACDKKVTKDKKDTFFIDCYAFGKQAETLVQYKHKGDQVIVTGELRQRFYDSKAGEKHKVVELYVSRIEFDCGQPKPQEEKIEAPNPDEFAPEQ